MRKLEPIARLNIRRPNMVKRGLVYLQNFSKAEPKMDADEVVKE